MHKALVFAKGLCDGQLQLKQFQCSSFRLDLRMFFTEAYKSTQAKLSEEVLFRLLHQSSFCDVAFFIINFLVN